MTDLTNRPYKDETDLWRMSELVRTIQAQRNFPVYPDAVDLHEHLLSPSLDKERHTRLWESAGDNLLGFAIVLARTGHLLFHVHPQASSDVEDQIIDWAVACPRLIEDGSQSKLRVQCREADRARRSLLRRHTFELEEWYVLDMARSLDEPIPVPQLPEGFRLRHVMGTQEVEAYVAMHRDAFGTSNMRVEERLAMMNDPGYIPELDLVIAAPDGTLVSFCVCWIDHEEADRDGRKVGHTDPVGTRTAYQRQGLGRAVLSAGLAQSKTYGVGIAALSTGSSNLPMQRLAMSVGFHTVSKVLSYTKDIMKFDQQNR